jgi:hypothetical protein
MLFRKVPGSYQEDAYGAQREQADSRGQFYSVQRAPQETVRRPSEIRTSVIW